MTTTGQSMGLSLLTYLVGQEVVDHCKGYPAYWIIPCVKGKDSDQHPGPSEQDGAPQETHDGDNADAVGKEDEEEENLPAGHKDHEIKSYSYRFLKGASLNGEGDKKTHAIVSGNERDVQDGDHNVIQTNGSEDGEEDENGGVEDKSNAKVRGRDNVDEDDAGSKDEDDVEVKGDVKVVDGVKDVDDKDGKDDDEVKGKGDIHDKDDVKDDNDDEEVKDKEDAEERILGKPRKPRHNVHHQSHPHVANSTKHNVKAAPIHPNHPKDSIPRNHKTVLSGQHNKSLGHSVHATSVGSKHEVVGPKSFGHSNHNISNPVFLRYYRKHNKPERNSTSKIIFKHVFKHHYNGTESRHNNTSDFNGQHRFMKRNHTGYSVHSGNSTHRYIMKHVFGSSFNSTTHAHSSNGTRIGRRPNGTGFRGYRGQRRRQWRKRQRSKATSGPHAVKRIYKSKVCKRTNQGNGNNSNSKVVRKFTIHKNLGHSNRNGSTIRLVKHINKTRVHANTTVSKHIIKHVYKGQNKHQPPVPQGNKTDTQVPNGKMSQSRLVVSRSHLDSLVKSANEMKSTNISSKADIRSKTDKVKVFKKRPVAVNNHLHRVGLVAVNGGSRRSQGQKGRKGQKAKVKKLTPTRRASRFLSRKAFGASRSGDNTH